MYHRSAPRLDFALQARRWALRIAILLGGLALIAQALPALSPDSHRPALRTTNQP